MLQNSEIIVDVKNGDNKLVFKLWPSVKLMLCGMKYCVKIIKL